MKTTLLTAIFEHLKQYSWWELTIFVIGTLSFISILVVLFLPIGNGPEEFTYSGNSLSASDPGFATMFSETLNVPQRKGQPIEILNNGDEFMTSFLHDIDNAKESINIMVYIWDSGKMSDEILQHLDAKLKEGIEVRIMLDAYGAPGATKRKEFKTFTELGGKTSVFHSFTLAPWDFARDPKRNHRRAIVIDGKIGYTGGMAVGDEWLGNASSSKEYRDLMFRTTGQMTNDIQGVFAETWGATTGEILTGNKFYPEQISSNQNTLTYLPLTSTPSPDSLVIQKFILLSIRAAQKNIYITTPYFIPDQSLNDLLIEKAKEGIDVRILVPNKYNDSASVRHASQYSYQELLKNGVKIYEYQPTFIHTKTIVIDGQWSVIGSANMDNRSRKLNQEDVFGVSDKTFGQALEVTFMGDLKNADQIDLAQWKKRGIWQRFLEVFDLKFVKQY